MTPNVQRQEASNALFEKCGVIWAFSNEQLNDGIQKLRTSGMLLDNDKLVSIGMGGYMPKKKCGCTYRGAKRDSKSV